MWNTPGEPTGERSPKSRASNAVSRSHSRTLEEAERSQEMRKLLLPTLGSPSPTKSRADYRSLVPSTLSPQPTKTLGATPALPARTRALPPGLIAVAHAIVSDLENRPTVLLSLNPSRREAIQNHLNKIAGTTPRAQLSGWVQNARGHQESQALQTYFEEVALITLLQALLLKRWSDRGLRPFRPEHLGKLNFELSNALKPHVPIHREGFHLTRPNLYSWYTPPPHLLNELYQALQEFTLAEESPAFLMELATEGRRFSPEWPELLGYDERFYSDLVDHLYHWAVTSRTSNSTRKIAYSPTLRFGQITYGKREQVQWVGGEENTFALLVAEMIDLWSGPKAPLLWTNSTTLDAHPKEQLTLVAPGLRPGLLAALSEMEACDFGWLSEERTHKASRYKTLMDSLPFYKKLRAPGTSLGTLQAGIALTKIRPGGRLVWAREEPLTSEEGTEALGFILARGTLIAEIDLTSIEHTLPIRRPLFPRYLYVFERQINAETRASHRPVRWMARGSIRSHVEVSLFLSDLFQTTSASSPQLPILPKRSNWQFISQICPIPQKEWAHRWPDPHCVESILEIERLSIDSQPLAEIATVRAHSRSDWDPSKTGFNSTTSLLLECRVELEKNPSASEEVRFLSVSSIENRSNETEFSGISLHLRNEHWRAPLAAYLQSKSVRTWLEHHAERKLDKKQEKWVLSESLVRMIPIPRRLVRALERWAPSELLPSETRTAIQKIVKNPDSLSFGGTSEENERSYLFGSWALRELEASLKQMQPYLTPDRRVDWSRVVALFQIQDTVSFSQHPLVSISGQIPIHSPITKIDRLKAPQNGILLMTESGAYQKILFENALLAEMAWDQVRALIHPTWSELVRSVRLPRALELAEAAARDILNSFESLVQRRNQILERIHSGFPST